jgi:hypothetical protein
MTLLTEALILGLFAMSLDLTVGYRHCHVNELRPPSSSLSPDFGAG